MKKSITSGLVKDRPENLVETKAQMVRKFKMRMLQWSNPVEYVNNMYGCHPDEEEGNDYFKEVFSK